VHLRVKTLLSCLLSSSLLLLLASASQGESSRLTVKIQSPQSERAISGPPASVQVSGVASALGGVPELDLIFVLDTSRSLNDSDPYDHRRKGASELIDSLPSGADIRIGIVGFDRKAELITPLTSNRKQVADALARLGRQGLTNIAEGIRTALADFQAHARPDSTKVVLVFTDGRSDPKQARQAMMQAREQGVIIHSVLLGTDPLGREILAEIADVTGGTFVQVDDPRKLPDAFLALRTSGVERVTLRVNDSDPIVTNLEAGRFNALVDLEAGENRIVATALALDGERQTDSVTVLVRPPGCGELRVGAMAGGRAVTGLERRSVEIVLDASGSMWGQIDGRSKMEIARQTLEETLGWLPSDLSISLRAYGHQHPREARDCADTQVLVAPGLGNRDRIRDAIRGLRPSGQTPIAYALAEAARDLATAPGDRSVILVTDGIESCGGDASKAARVLKERDSITVHVIGLGLSSEIDSDLEGLRSIARSSGGIFLTVRTVLELRDALATTAGSSFSVLQDGVPVATGTLGSSRVLRLPPGQYLLRVDSRPPVSVPVTLVSENRSSIDFQLKSGKLAHSLRQEAAAYAVCEGSEIRH